MKTIGVKIADRGAVICHVDRDGDELIVTAVERLPFSLDAVADRVDELDRELAEVRFIVDSEGLGQALWAVVGPPESTSPWADAAADRWTLYAGRGVERQALVDRLLVAIHEGRFHFAPNLPEQEAMTKALQSYRRQVREDGLIGSELVVALLLAIIPPEPIRETLAAWGYAPGTRPVDDIPADGAVVGGLVMRHAPDGSLVAVLEEPNDD